jgi:hypothetical protein
MDDFDLLAALLGYTPNSVRSGIEELARERAAAREALRAKAERGNLVLRQFERLDSDGQESLAPYVLEEQARRVVDELLELRSRTQVEYVNRLQTRLKASEAELERERMRLVACGVVTQANTRESAAKARDMHPDFRSASCDDVARAVDREMELRGERARAVRSSAEESTEDLALRATWSMQQLRSVDGALDAAERENGDAPHRALGRSERIRRLAAVYRGCGDARAFVRNIGPERGRQAVEAGRKFLGSFHQPEKVAFTREEVNLISMMEAKHIAVEAVAAEMGMRK